MFEAIGAFLASFFVWFAPAPVEAPAPAPVRVEAQHVVPESERYIRPVEAGDTNVNGRIDPGETRPAPAPAPSGGGRIEEDEPGWDCHTMGNRICGTDVIELGSVSEATWDRLLSVGWHGCPGDGKEALYGPYVACS